MTRLVFSTMDALAAELVDRTAAAAAQAIAARGTFSLACTGGSAATTFYPVLAQAPLPFGSMHVFLGDERYVPHDHADSNARLVASTLLDPARHPAALRHFPNTALAPSEAAAHSARDLEQIAGGVLDVVHLGMGPDGHICSLFAGHPALDDDSALMIPVENAPKPPPRRLTLSMRAVRAARALVFIVTGAAKAPAVRDVVLDAACTLPAARAARGHPNVTWLLDHEAGRHIRNG